MSIMIDVQTISVEKIKSELKNYKPNEILHVVPSKFRLLDGYYNVTEYLLITDVSLG